jgi:predicted transcriptional regulator YdeE
MTSIRNILTGLFAHSVEGLEPRIVELEQPIKIAGMSVKTGTRTVYRDVPRLGKQLEAYKREHGISNKKQPWGFVAASRDFDDQNMTFSYIMGDVVTSFEGVPADLIAFEVPAGTYAVFPVRPKNRWGWAIAIPDAKRYAYTVWLPDSEYEPAAGGVDDFEYHDERSTRKKNPEIDLYVAVRRRV